MKIIVEWHGFEKSDLGTSLVVQWLRLQASTAGGMGLILGQGTKILHASQCSQNIKKWNKILKIL